MRRIKSIRISADEFQAFCDLRQKHRWDWPATFSTNSNGDIWGFQTYGYTPPARREDIREASPLLDQVADIYRDQREECGRFFIDHRGAFFKEDGAEVQFVQWNSGGETLRAPSALAPHVPPARPKLSLNELLETVRMRRKGNR